MRAYIRASRELVENLGGASERRGRATQDPPAQIGIAILSLLLLAEFVGSTTMIASVPSTAGEPISHALSDYSLGPTAEKTRPLIGLTCGSNNHILN